MRDSRTDARIVTPGDPSDRTVAGWMLLALALGAAINGLALLYAGRPLDQLASGNYAPGAMMLVLGLLLAIVGTGAIIDESRRRRCVAEEIPAPRR